MGGRLTLLLLTLLAGCGHTARYTEEPLDYVQLFDGIQHRYQIRIPYKVHRYDPLPERPYTSSHWIGLDGTPPILTARASQTLDCPEGTTSASGSNEIRGSVTIEPETATVALEEYIYRSGAWAWHPYQRNGQYRLLQPTDSAIQVANAEDEAAAREIGLPTVIYCRTRTGARSR